MELLNLNNLEDHQPLDSNQKIWRYLSFDRYLYLVTSGNLWFSRVDKIGDRFEGSVTHASNQTWKAVFTSIVPEESLGEVIANHSKTRMTSPKLVMGNCWHRSEDEEMLMWKLYSDRNGIAISSSPVDFENAWVSNKDVFVNNVRYKDYSPVGDGGVFGENLLSQASSRPDYLYYEKEVRLVLFNPGLESDFKDYEDLPTGVGIPVDVSKLITKVVIKPEAELWVKEALEKVHALLGLDIQTVQSKFNFDPVW